MKILTVLQPWASAIMSGNKRIENRNWKPNSPMLATAKKLVGQRIGIHAGARWYEVMKPEPEHVHLLNVWAYTDNLPLGAILGTVMLDAVLDRRFIVPDKFTWVFDHPWAMRDATTWLVLSDPQPFAKPIHAKGMRGFWNWEATK